MFSILQSRISVKGIPVTPNRTGKVGLSLAGCRRRIELSPGGRDSRAVQTRLFGLPRGASGVNATISPVMTGVAVGLVSVSTPIV